MDIVYKLIQKYPEVNYSSLIKQTDDLETDDECTYYRDQHNFYENTNLNIVYAWNFIEKEWERQTEFEAKSVQCLFN